MSFSTNDLLLQVLNGQKEESVQIAAMKEKLLAHLEACDRREAGLEHRVSSLELLRDEVNEAKGSIRLAYKIFGGMATLVTGAAGLVALWLKIKAGGG